LNNFKIYKQVFVSNSIAFLVVGLSYFTYTKILSPFQLGIYSSAVVLSSIGTLLLESGVKNCILRTKEKVDNILVIDIIVFQYLIVFLILLIWSVVYLNNSVLNIPNINFLFLYSIIYWFTSPIISTSTGILEKKMNFKIISTIEPIYLIIERGLPILFLLLYKSINAFIIASTIARIFRVICLYKYIDISFENYYFKGVLNRIRKFSKEVFNVFFGLSSSLIRDNLHVILIGSLCGVEWIGYYAFGLQICVMASQVFVQVSTRLTSSFISNIDNSDDKLYLIYKQIEILSKITTPILVITLLIFPMINNIFFDNKWNNLIGLLPFLLARMVLGIASTPVGGYVIIEDDTLNFNKKMWIWTGFECILGYISIMIFGQIGLAISYSITVWIGLFIITYRTKINFYLLIKKIFEGNTFFISIIVSFLYFCFLLKYNSKVYLIITIAIILFVNLFLNRTLILFYLKKWKLD
jgi:O-antigen/teichoic acid export membrane protein